MRPLGGGGAQLQPRIVVPSIPLIVEGSIVLLDCDQQQS
jgi:hypothetical protein